MLHRALARPGGIHASPVPGKAILALLAATGLADVAEPPMTEVHQPLDDLFRRGRVVGTDVRDLDTRDLAASDEHEREVRSREICERLSVDVPTEAGCFRRPSAVAARPRNARRRSDPRAEEQQVEPAIRGLGLDAEQEGEVEVMLVGREHVLERVESQQEVPATLQALRDGVRRIAEFADGLEDPLAGLAEILAGLSTVSFRSCETVA